MKIALTIAGSDPTGGAGLQSDLKTFNLMGVYGLSIPSVFTAQNTEGVYDIHKLPPEFFLVQFDTLLKDIQPDALKTGMLYSIDIISILKNKIEQYSLKNLVVDPVIVSSTGMQLIEEKGLDVMKKDLFPLSTVITPNIYEASILTGMEIQDEKDVKEAAVRLRDYGSRAVIITGRHSQEKIVDLLFDGEEFLFLENELLGGQYHGTGCVFSSVVTACLALDYNLKEAFIKANDFTYSAIKTAVAVGKGMKILNVEVNP